MLTSSIFQYNFLNRIPILRRKQKNANTKGKSKNNDCRRSRSFSSAMCSRNEEY